jgi:cell division protein FtsB
MGWHSDEPDELLLPALLVWAGIFVAVLVSFYATRESRHARYEQIRQEHVTYELRLACLSGGRDWIDGRCR